ncbi:hypothetical protein IWQ60_012195 [Tieghemiomyces parasiticus]|uniref:6-phosphofructo-2-kinase domain-containing protein n=1 Tax=Tieghemiomyces parasiticus TaxID=78921 RepID=A0A9W8DLL2_9FUNG|nr:hypothetical protein IWQ60_012195 [Tieghemiomyces parasiticus]
MAAQLYKTESGRLFHAGAFAFITVGLPARGKTHISRALGRYLSWLGVPTKTFHVGQYRRQLVRRYTSHNFFDPANDETTCQRKQAADQALEDMIAFLLQGGQVGIYDGGNATAERRRYMLERLQSNNIQTVFIESVCNDEKIVNANIRNVKVNSEDYRGWDLEEAINDFKERIKVTEPFYETIEDESLSYIKLINVNQQIIVNHVKGFLPSRMVFYLMNLHTAPRAIYFARNGYSTGENSYKADSPLSDEGHRYAKRLQEVITARRKARADHGDCDAQALKIWTSTRCYSYSTAEYFNEFPVRHRKSLAEINPGICDGLTNEEIKAQYPREFQAHLKDAYRHRYPRGESYHDLAVRLESVILELEHEKQDVLIIAHESVLRTLYAYFRGIQPEGIIPYIAMPRNVLLEICPSAYGIRELKVGIPRD